MNLVAFASYQQWAIVIFIFALGAAMIWYASAAPARAQKTRTASDVAEAPVVPQAAVLPQPPLAPVAGPALAVPIAWTLRVDESAKDLDAATRLDLIERMGTIGGKWGADILLQAASEERDNDLRDAVLASLIECAQQSSQPAFERALAAERPAERVYAVDGLAAVGAFEAAAKALDDREEVVALAAAYALRASGQGALVERYISVNSGKDRASALRKMIDILS